MCRCIAYYRVSTKKQGASGLGLDDQKAAVRGFLKARPDCELTAEYTEIESGKKNDRPKLAEAMRQCRLTGAILVIGKLDRLSRDAAFLLGLERAGIEFIACDMPNANRLTVGVMALVAEDEGRRISARTKAALAAARARGTRLGAPKWNGFVPDHSKATAARIEAADGFASRVAPLCRTMRDAGSTLAQIAAEMERRGVMSARGGRWTAASVRNVLAR